MMGSAVRIRPLLPNKRPSLAEGFFTRPIELPAMAMSLAFKHRNAEAEAFRIERPKKALS